MRRIWLGLRPSQMAPEDLHWPLIECRPTTRPEGWSLAWKRATDAIWTSRTAVQYAVELLTPQERQFYARIRHWCVGAGTAAAIQRTGGGAYFVALQETAEGLIQLLEEKAPLDGSWIWLHSAQSREVMRLWAQRSHRILYDHPLYSTHVKSDCPPPPMTPGDQLVFTSPTTVYAWQSYGWSPPDDVTVHAIGPITERALLLAMPGRIVECLDDEKEDLANRVPRNRGS